MLLLETRAVSVNAIPAYVDSSCLNEGKPYFFKEVLFKQKQTLLEGIGNKKKRTLL
jgi:hypothetical protein